MFDVGGGELILIFIAVLLLFGPKKIPEVMKMAGKGLRQFRQAQEDLKTQLRDISADVERAADVRTVQPAVSFTAPVSHDFHPEAEEFSTPQPSPERDEMRPVPRSVASPFGQTAADAETDDKPEQDA